MNVKVNPIRLMVEMSIIFVRHDGFQKIKDDEGNFIVPLDRYEDFCHDMGLILGKILVNIVRPQE